MLKTINNALSAIAKLDTNKAIVKALNGLGLKLEIVIKLNNTNNNTKLSLEPVSAKNLAILEKLLIFNNGVTLAILKFVTPCNSMLTARFKNMDKSINSINVSKDLSNTLAMSMLAIKNNNPSLALYRQGFNASINKPMIWNNGFFKVNIQKASIVKGIAMIQAFKLANVLAIKGFENIAKGKPMLTSKSDLSLFFKNLDTNKLAKNRVIKLEMLIIKPMTTLFWI